MVASSAPFIFQHSSIGLKQFGKGRAAAAVNYQTNDRKCEKLITVNLPNCNRYALRDAVQRYEDALPRRDSRVAEMFVAGFDRALSADHRELVAKRFLWRMTAHGRSRAWAALHHNDPENPHLHAGYLDRDIDTGKSVQMMTGTPKARLQKGMDRTGTDFARRMWEESHNSVYAEFGYERVMDRRSHDKRREAANENGHVKKTVESLYVGGDMQTELPSPIHDAPPHAPSPLLEDTPPDAHAAEPEQEQDMADERYFGDTEDAMAEYAKAGMSKVEREALEQRHPALDPAHPEYVDDFAPRSIEGGRRPVDVVEKVKAAHQLTLRIKEVQQARSTLLGLQRGFDQAMTTARTWTRHAEWSQNEIRKAEDDQSAARYTLSRHQWPDGRLKGFALFGLRTPARKRAEAAQTAADDAKVQVARRVIEAAEAVKVAQQQTQAADTAARNLQRYDAELAEKGLGTIHEMNVAEEACVTSRNRTLEQTRPVDVFTAWEKDELTAEEAADAFAQLGDTHYAQMLRDALEQEHGEGMEA